MRLLFGTWSASGPLRPLIPLMRAAEAAGHEVAIVGDAGLSGHSELDGFHVEPVPDLADVITGFDEVALKRAEEALPPGDRPAFAVANALQQGVALAPYVLDVIDRVRPDVVVREFIFHAALLGAARRDIPAATVMLLPISERFIVEMAKDAYRDAFRATGSFADPTDIVSGLTEVFALPSIWFGPVGPPDGAVLVRPSEPTPADDGTAARLLEGLGASRPLVYVTLGTTYADEPNLFRTVLDGVAGAEVDAVVTTGPTVDPDSLGDYPDNIRITRFVPQTLLLSRCAAVVAHAGYGTTFGAMRLGLPMVTIPIASSDNAINAARLRDLGAAIAIGERDRSALAIRTALQRVLDEMSYRLAAQDVARELARTPGPELAISTFEAIAS